MGFSCFYGLKHPERSPTAFTENDDSTNENQCIYGFNSE